MHWARRSVARAYAGHLAVNARPQCGMLDFLPFALVVTIWKCSPGKLTCIGGTSSIYYSRYTPQSSPVPPGSWPRRSLPILAELWRVFPMCHSGLSRADAQRRRARVGREISVTGRPGTAERPRRPAQPTVAVGFQHRRDAPHRIRGPLREIISATAATCDLRSPAHFAAPYSRPAGRRLTQGSDPGHGAGGQAVAVWRGKAMGAGLTSPDAAESTCRSWRRP